MTFIQKTGFVAAIVAGIGVTACAAEPVAETAAEEEGSAPDVGLDTAEEQTEGSSYVGWTHTPIAVLGVCLPPYNRIGHNLARTSGDATRGGGGCFVRKTTTSCTSNSYAGDNFCTCGTSTCIADQTTPTAGSAQALYGSSAYGYCYQSKCYHRPGSQAALCALNPNRTPGTIAVYPGGTIFGLDNNDYTLGCMTKTVGPNGACGQSNPNDYMRSVAALQYDFGGCPF